MSGKVVVDPAKQIVEREPLKIPENASEQLKAVARLTTRTEAHGLRHIPLEKWTEKDWTIFKRCQEDLIHLITVAEKYGPLKGEELELVRDYAGITVIFSVRSDHCKCTAVHAERLLNLPENGSVLPGRIKRNPRKLNKKKNFFFFMSF
jgi:hypothetical protein